MKKISPITKKRYLGFIKTKVKKQRILVKYWYLMQDLKGHAKTQVEKPKLLIKYWNLSQSPFRQIRKQANTCVIGNGIPKSGTYFLHKIIEYVGKWEDLKLHILDRGWCERQITLCPVKFSVRKLRAGQFAPAHLRWSKPLEKRISRSSQHIKHVFIYRDPRDVCCSYMNFVLKHPRAIFQRSERKFMLENFSNDAERLTYVIKKMIVENPSEHFLNYAPWLHSSHCYAVRFEDLYRDILKAKDGVVGEVLRSLLNYLDVNPADIDPIDFYNKVYNKGKTASSEMNKISQYKRVFKEQHYALLDNPEFKHMLKVFGYAWS